MLDFNVGGTFYPNSAEFMKDVMDINAWGEPAVHDPHHNVSQEHDKDNDTEVTASLVNDQFSFPRALSCELYLLVWGTYLYDV